MTTPPTYSSEMIGESIALFGGDCLPVLRAMLPESVDCVITDPPYGLADHKPAAVTTALTAWANGDRERVPDGKGFMGRAWDAFVPPPAVWDECLRVLKPGGHLLCFAGTRTVDLMGLSIRLAGFEIRDSLTWLYGSGFPKSLDVSKAIDKRGGADIAWFGPWLRGERERRGISQRDLCERGGFHGGVNHGGAVANWELGLNLPTVEQFNALCRILDSPFDSLVEAEREITQHGTAELRPGGTISFDQRGSKERERRDTPATDAARQWAGWGTALKPASEPIIVARKPLIGTVAANVTTHGTGGINVDACRVATSAADAKAMERCNSPRSGRMSTDKVGQLGTFERSNATGALDTTAGRWPTNVVLSHGPECNGECQSGCPVAELDAQSGNRPSGGSKHERSTARQDVFGQYTLGRNTEREPDTGGASRFFPVFKYQAKAPTKERPKVDGKSHCTVKPLELMRWLVRLVTPPGGIVLDPFAGSGTTGQAAALEGMSAALIELDPHHLALIRQRLAPTEVEPDPEQEDVPA